LPTSPTLLEYWYSALRSERGIRLRVSGCTREQFQQQLYKSRSEELNPDLAKISIVFPPTESDEIWLVKREAV
jgi:hypothetical protein